MQRLVQQDLRTLNALLLEIYAHRDLETFPAQMLAALSRIMPADIRGYNEVNLHRKRIVAITDPPDALSPDDEQIASQYLHEQPIVTAYKRTRDGRAYKMSDFLSRSQFHRLTLYNEFYRQRRTEDLMAITLPASAPLMIAFAFSRSRRTFSERDRTVLNLLRPHFTQAYYNASAVTQVQQEVVQLKQVLEESNRGIIVLTGQGRVRLMTDCARKWLQKYYGLFDGRHTYRLPEDLWRWVCQQQSVLAPQDAVPPSRTPLVIEREGQQLVVRLLTDQAEGQMFLLLEEQGPIMSPALLASLGLTKREHEILYWLAQGKTNKEIAQVLGLSPHTIRSRLEDVYSKLGVSARAGAVRWFLEAGKGQ
jgi:DNA-binding CsgD family transcriptional regulator